MAFSALLLANVLVELLGGALSASRVGMALQGPLIVVGYVLAPAALLVWLTGHGIQLWRRLDGWFTERKRVVSRAKGSPARLAEQAAHWGGRLASDAAAEAVRWFEAHEKSLRDLLAEDAQRGSLTASEVDDVAAVASALETYFVHRRMLDELLLVNWCVQEVASQAGRADLEQLTALRVAAAHRLLGDLVAARAELEKARKIAERTPRPHAAALEARQRHEWALIHLAAANRHTDDDRAAADELENAARLLEAEWARLPRSDISGQITALVNLAVVALHQKRLRLAARKRDPAFAGHSSGPHHRRMSRVRDHLGLAEALARRERDLAGVAHVIELRGVVAWLDDQHRLAAESWRDARYRYAELGLVDGEARCLQHLGSAIVVVPEVAGLLRDNQWVALGDRETTEAEARLLEERKALRAELPHLDAGLTDHYLDPFQDHRRLGLTVRGGARSWWRRLLARASRWWKGLP